METIKLSNNKRIMKNTILLYGRMIFMMAISLYTSRVVLSVLGVVDFGIYNVVGGIVIVLSFLNTSMAGATQRFLNMELGKRDFLSLKKVFATSIVIHMGIAFLVLILAETIGIWFLNTHMTIPLDRLTAANWVFQFSVISFLVTILAVPFNAAIIAHEEMTAFAYISIIEAILKLLIVYLLVVIPIDKLIMYALLMVLVSTGISLSYCLFCTNKFNECKGISLQYDKYYMSKMLGFSGWTVVGALGSISHTQGVAIVMNMFFGVTVNAALGIANQVTNAVNQFVTNFMIALNPQIVKTYAANELDSMHLLMKRGARMGISLVAFFAVPLIVETPVILNIWLKEVPEYTVTFIRIILLTSICNAYAQPLSTAKAATGKIKQYQIVLTTLGLLHLPLAWMAFVMGGSPFWAMYVYFVLVNIIQTCRIIMVCRSVNLSIMGFVKDVCIRCSLMVFVSFFVPGLFHFILPASLLNSLIVICIAFMSTGFSIITIALTKTERLALTKIIKKRIGITS